jgi:hypothetical protein
MIAIIRVFIKLILLLKQPKRRRQKLTLKQKKKKKNAARSVMQLQRSPLHSLI